MEKTNEMSNNRNNLNKECLNSITYRDKTLANTLKNIYNNKNNNLSEIEYQLIHSYTANNSYWINIELRKFGFNSCDCKNQVVNLINSGLDKISGFNNNIVYRMEPNNIYETTRIKNWYRKNLGAIIQAPFFLSTSKEDSEWEEREITLKIRTNSNSLGKDLYKIGIDTPEKEILFKTNSIFKITDVNEKYIELNEIEKTTKTPIFWKITNE